jgi:cytochrome P450
MSDVHLDASDPETKERASNVFLRDIVISFVLAGRDSTSAAQAWFFHALSRNPKAL